MVFSPELKLCSALWSVDLVCGGGLCWSSGSVGLLLRFLGALALVKQHLRHKGGGGACYTWFRPPLLALLCLLKLVYAEGHGREMAPEFSFIPRERRLCLSLSG